MLHGLSHRRTGALLATTAIALCWSQAAMAQSAWIGAGGGDWGTATNWSPNGVPNAAGAEAVFNAPFSAGFHSVDLAGGNYTIGTLRIQSARNYQVLDSGAGATLNFQVPAGNALIDVTDSSATGAFFSSSFPINVNLVSNTDVNVAAAKLLRFGAGTTLTGAGELVLVGPGTVQIDAAGTRTGVTRLNSGTLDIRNTAALGTGDLVVQGGELRANAGGTLANDIDVAAGGAFRAVVADGQTVTSTGDINVQANVTALQFGQANSTGTWVFANTNHVFIGGGPLPVYTFDVLGGTVRGADQALGFLTSQAVATNIAAGATLDFTAAGTNPVVANLQSAGTVNAAAGVGLIVGGGSVSGAITGSGSVDVATPATYNFGRNTGNLVLTGTNTYTGGTRIFTNATLSLGAGGTTGSIVGNVLNTNGNLVFNRSNLYQFDGIISGTGRVRNDGVGVTALTAANTYTGNTTVNAGMLLVNGSIASSALTTVNTGGTLGGSGTVGNTTINGGTLSPGNSIGTLTVQGNLVLTAASTYLIEVSPASADRTNVTGTATLGGAAVRATYAAGSYVARQYTILNATGGISGTFSSLVNTNLPSSFAASLSYDANNAYLDLKLGVPNFGPNLSTNQTNVAQALVNSFNTAGGIPLAFGALTPQGLTQVSGEAATGGQQTTFQAMDAFMTMMTDPFLGSRSGGAPQGGATGYADDESLAYASSRKGRTAAERDAYAKMAVKAPPRMTFERRWSVWGAGYGGTQSTDGNAAVGSNDVTSRVYGGAAGFDYRLTPETVVGFSLGGAGTKYNLANVLGGGSSEMFQAGIYGRHHFGPGYIAGALAYAWQDVTTDRVALLNSYRANFDANAISGRLEAGYRYAFGTSGVTPYAAGQFTTFFLPDYAEQVVAGTNIFALSYASKDVTASRSELGLRADTSFAAQDAVVTLRGRAAWAHNFNTDSSVSAIFQTLPASGFVVNGAAQARDAALVSAGAEARWLNGFSVAATFEGEFSSVTESYAGKGIVRYQW